MVSCLLFRFFRLGTCHGSCPPRSSTGLSEHQDNPVIPPRSTGAVTSPTGDWWKEYKPYGFMMFPTGGMTFGPAVPHASDLRAQNSTQPCGRPSRPDSPRGIKCLCIIPSSPIRFRGWVKISSYRTCFLELSPKPPLQRR